MTTIPNPVAADDPRQAEYRFTCPDCRSLPGHPCRTWTTGYAMHTSHRARYELLTPED